MSLFLLSCGMGSGEPPAGSGRPDGEPVTGSDSTPTELVELTRVVRAVHGEARFEGGQFVGGALGYRYITLEAFEEREELEILCSIMGDWMVEAVAPVDGVCWDCEYQFSTVTTDFLSEGARCTDEVVAAVAAEGDQRDTWAFAHVGWPVEYGQPLANVVYVYGLEYAWRAVAISTPPGFSLYGWTTYADGVLDFTGFRGYPTYDM